MSGGLGPLVVGLITDHVFGRDGAIAYSLAIVAAVYCPLAALLMASGMAAFASGVAIEHRRQQRYAPAA